MSRKLEYFIGVDLGTNGIKAGILDLRGKVLHTSYWETKLEASGVDKVKQDIDHFYISTLKIIKEVISKSDIKPSNIGAIAIDGQMGGIIGVDQEFDSVTGLDMGLDIRSESYNNLIHRKHHDLIASISCGSPRNTPKMMWWKRQYPAIYKKISKFVTLNGYVNGKICGLKGHQAVIDHTLLSFFGNEDARKLVWSERLSDLFGIDIGKLPDIVEPWKKIGTVSGYASKVSGLLEGTPVMAGAGDQPAGFLGAGMLRKGSIIDISGSSTIMQYTVGEFRPDKKSRTVMYMPAVTKGLYHAFIYINGGGITLRWFREQFLSKNKETPIEDLYGIIEDKAKKIPAGSEGLIFLPYMGGRQCPYSESIRGCWSGINWGHKKEHFYRAILESLAYDTKLGFDAIKRLFPDMELKNIPVTGGGSKSGLFNQIKADVSGLSYTKTIDDAFAIRGSGLIAGYGVGAFKDLVEVSRDIDIIDKGCNYIPEKKNTVIYSKYLDIFKKMLNRPLKQTYDDIYMM